MRMIGTMICTYVYLRRVKPKLILSGSSIGMIQRVSFRGDAPLYGRKSLTLEVTPLEAQALTQWFPIKTPEEVMQIYGIFGGTPAYLEHVDESLSAVENAHRVILSKSGALYDEPEFLLMQEVRNPGAYMDIMGAISAGRQRISEISDYTKIPRENLPKYIASFNNHEASGQGGHATERDSELHARRPVPALLVQVRVDKQKPS